MSVLIRGMEMPKNCDNCPCYYVTEGAWRNECEVLEREHYITDERPDWCPLVPVPPHGRLIDADALEQDIRKNAEDAWNKEASPINWADAFYELADMVADAPTIIPAEEGE